MISLSEEKNKANIKDFYANVKLQYEQNEFKYFSFNLVINLHMKDWVGLPAGVKFDPTDQELIEHLEAKVKEEGARSHPLIDEFIPTIEGEDGICYTHPEKLPGMLAVSNKIIK